MEMYRFQATGGEVARGKDHLTEHTFYLQIKCNSIPSCCLPLGHLMVCAQQEQWW